MVKNEYQDRNDQSINVIFGLKEQHYQNMIKQNLLHKYRDKFQK